MSLLRSYSFGIHFGYNEIPADVLRLFANVDSNKRLEYAGTIVENAMLGRIDTSKPFNLDGYETRVKFNEKLSTNQKGKKELYIGDDVADADEVVRTGGLTPNMVSAQSLYSEELGYSKILNKAEFRYALNRVNALKSELFISEGVDIRGLILDALNGIPSATKVLKELCNKYDELSSLIKILLSSKLNLEEELKCLK